MVVIVIIIIIIIIIVVVVVVVVVIIIIHFLSALVPDSVKKELLQKIKAYLVQDM